jgi:hypothetical protein
MGEEVPAAFVAVTLKEMAVPTVPDCAIWPWTTPVAVLTVQLVGSPVTAKDAGVSVAVI